MFEIHEISPLEISSKIRNLFSMDKLYYAAKSPFRNSVVCWFRSDLPRQQIECEFDLELQQEVLGNERLKVLPKITDFVLPDTGYLVRGHFAIKTEGNCVLECYEIFSPDGKVKITEIAQKLYSDCKLQVEELCAQKLRQIQFTEVYAQWPIADKIHYWVGTLYKFRRQVGESGKVEDDAFSPGLVDKMRVIDANLDCILLPIIAGLAMMENEDPSRLAQSFSSRTGVDVK